MNKLVRTVTALLLTLFLVTAAWTSQAAVIYVDSAAVSGLQNGASWADAYLNLDAALSASVTGDEIWVADGTYYPGLSGDNAASFAMKRGVTVYGGFTGLGGLEETALSQRDFNLNLSILSGDLDQSGTLNAADAFHVLDGIGEDTTAIFDGLVITGGNAVGSGIGNRGGGAILASGGGAFVNCTFEGNHTSNFGGAIYSNVQLKVINCTFRGNTSGQFGGAIYLFASTPIKVYSSVFVDNVASQEGGALYCFSTTAQIYNCSFSGNQCNLGAVLRNRVAGLELRNSILWGNIGIDINGTAPTVTDCIIEGGYSFGTNVLDVDPGFLDNDLRTGPCSPAVDAGDSLLLVTTDRDDQPRPFDADNDGTARWDIGAYEAQVVGTLPPANPVLGPNPACTLGEDNVYTVTTNNFPTNTYQWTLIGGGTIDGASDSSSVLVDWGSGVGTYFLFVTETIASTGCATNDTITVVLDTVPVVTIAPTGSSTICDEDSVQLMASGQGAGFQWLLNGQMVPGATGSSFFAKDSGFVNVFLTDGNGCRDSAATNFELVVNPLPEINFTTSQPLPICQGDTVTISIPPATSQQWYNGGTPLAGETGASLEVSANGQFNVFQTDANGCSDSADVGLVVVVNPLPVLTVNPAATDTICPGDSLGLTGNASGASSFQWTRDGIVVPSATSNPYFADQSGFYNVLLTDNNGCTDSAAVGHRVRVGDFENPAPVCQNATVYLDGTGQITIAPGLLDGGSMDNCGVDSLALGKSQFVCADTGVNMVTLTVFDGVGNNASCQAMLTVEDTVRPVAVCVNATLYLDGSGNLVVQPADIDGGSSDNCGIASFQVDNPNFACADTGNHVLTLTVIDVSGNVNQCQSTIQVVDSTSPQALCQDTIVFLDPMGNASITASSVNANSSDNCGGDTFFVDRTQFGCAEVPSATVTLTVRDVSGNTATCTAQVRVRDTVPPLVACFDTTIYIDNNGQALLSPADLDGGSSDNCGIVNGVLSQSLFTCLDTGLTVVTVSFADADTNISSCISNVTIRDTVPPVAVCSDTTFYIDSLGTAVVEPLVFGVNSVDNCTFFDTAYVNVGPFSCGDIGQYQVTLVVQDVAGQIDSCSGQVTIADSTGPFVQCKDTALILDAGGNASLTAQDLDLGTFDNCTLDTFFIDRDSFGCGDAGFNTVIFTALDIFGNTSNCISTVEIVDSVAPVALCQDVSLYLDNAGTASLVPADLDNGSSDNCGLDSLALSQSQFSCADTGLQVITLEVFDQYGNVETCTGNVTVRDTISPAAICNDSLVYLDQNGAFQLTLGTIGSASSDNCGLNQVSFSQTSFACADTGTTTVTLFLSDPSNNSSSCTASLAVRDSTPPTVICPDTTLFLDSLGTLTISAQTVGGGSFDNCSIVASTISQASFVCADTGLIPLNLTFTDPSGNTTPCSLILTLRDSTPPTVLCQTFDIFLNSGGGVIGAGAIDAGSFDGCGIDTLYLSQTFFTCADVGATPVTLYGQDVSGNLDSCVVNVQVRDSVAPNAVCVSYTAYVDSLGNVPLVPADLDGGSTDDCVIDTAFINPPFLTCSNFGTNLTQLIVEDQDGNLDSCSATVTVLDTLAPEAICDSVVVQLNASGGAMLTPMLIGGNSFDNCNIDSMYLDIDSLNCSNAGFTDVRLTLTDSSGNQSFCVGVVEIVDTTGITSVSVNLGPDTLICNGDSIVLSANAPYPSYLWSTGEMTPSIATNQPGTYFLDITSPEGCGGSDTIQVGSAVVPDPNLRTESGEEVICQNDSLELEVNPGYVAYLWSTGDTGTVTTASTAGTYAVEVTDESGCTLVSTVQIAAVASPAPVPVILPAGPVVELCEGDIVTLDAGAGYFQYLWSNGATTQSFATGDPGTFTVEVWNGFGCHTVADPVEVVSVAAPIPFVTVNNDTLIATASGVTNWQWSLGGQPIFGANDSVYIVPVNGNYTVTATYANGCARTSLPVPVLVALADPQQILSGVTAFPNPSDGIFSLQTEKQLKGEVFIRISDVWGQAVWMETWNGWEGEQEINLSHLPAGIYVVELIHRKGVARIKLSRR